MQIFSNPYASSMSWSAQGAIVQWGLGSKTSDSLPLFMTSLQLSYQRKASAMYPINTNAAGDAVRVDINAPPVGSLNIGSIFGPTTGSMQAFLEAVGRDCVAQGKGVCISVQPFGRLTCQAGDNSTAATPQLGATFLLRDVKLQQLNLAIEGGEAAMVNMPTAYSFLSMEWTDGSGTSTGTGTSGTVRPGSNRA